MAKKNRKIIPPPKKVTKTDRKPNASQKKPVPESSKKKPQNSAKGKPAPIKKGNVKNKVSPKKTKKIVKPAAQKVGGFSRNNFNYIRSLIWQNYKGDFTSYFDPSLIRVVKEIFNDCKAAGITCSEKVIKEKYEQLKSDDKRPKPYILPYFIEPKVYYEIKDVPFPTLAPYLYVVSPMILSYPHEFRITDYYKKTLDSSGRELLDIKGYDKYFADWVNWCNTSMRTEHGNDYDSEELEICFKMTDAEYNQDKKRWETYIYICTPSGRIDSFGYKPEHGFIKDEEPEYRIPSTEVLTEEPIQEKEESKIKRITRKQKINDTISSWNSFFGSIKKSSEKAEREKYAHELDEIKSTRTELEKALRGYKRKKDARRSKQIQKELDKLNDRFLKLIQKRFK